GGARTDEPRVAQRVRARLEPGEPARMIEWGSRERLLEDRDVVIDRSARDEYRIEDQSSVESGAVAHIERPAKHRKEILRLGGDLRRGDRTLGTDDVAEPGRAGAQKVRVVSRAHGGNRSIVEPRGREFAHDEIEAEATERADATRPHERVIDQ